MKKISFVLLFLIIALCSCSAKEVSNNYPSPEQVIRNFYKAYNEKNQAEMNTYLTKGRYKVYWELENIESIKLISIDEKKAHITKSEYMKNGNGSQLKPVDVRIFWITFDVKLKDKKRTTLNNGITSWNCILVKLSKNSPWLIDDWGL